MDTIARIAGGYRGPPNMLVRRSGGQEITHVLREALPTFEQAVMLPDGWVALVRLAPFRVEWISADGRRLQGHNLPSDEVELDAAEKTFVLRRLAAEGSKPFAASDYPHWPRVAPPFLARAVLPMPSGRVAIRLTPSARHPEGRYYIVDRAAGLVQTMIVGSNQRIISFGPSTVVVVTRDEGGVERLSRHPM
ncbi:MAG: hypothetical protein IT361_19065 [Gemmatimonadaceae bacterium]|nr:hypothetical protein [Gemmatimonadaceae bacterium]